MNLKTACLFYVAGEALAHSYWAMSVIAFYLVRGTISRLLLHTWNSRPILFQGFSCLYFLSCSKSTKITSANTSDPMWVLRIWTQVFTLAGHMLYLLSTLGLFFLILFYECTCNACRTQRRTLWSWFSPYTFMWVLLGIELKLSSLCCKCFFLQNHVTGHFFCFFS